jgi:hypothetical protein
VGEPTFWDNVKAWIGSMAYDIFLWSLHITSEEYQNEITAEWVSYGNRVCEHIQKLPYSDENLALLAEYERLRPQCESDSK